MNWFYLKHIWKWKLHPTLCNPMDYRVHGILQARILEWVASPFSRGSSQTRNWTGVSCIAGRFLPTELSGKPYIYIYIKYWRENRANQLGLFYFNIWFLITGKWLEKVPCFSTNSSLAYRRSFGLWIQLSSLDGGTAPWSLCLWVLNLPLSTIYLSDLGHDS